MRPSIIACVFLVTCNKKINSLINFFFLSQNYAIFHYSLLGMPGEAQKIERLIQAFSHRYAKCNPEVVSKLQTAETVRIIEE
jgi:Sec7 domain